MESCGRLIPAQFTIPSSRPNRSTAACAARSHDSGLGDVARYAGFRLRLRGVQIGDDDLGACRGKLGADFGADAAGPAEDQDHFACALLHDYL